MTLTVAEKRPQRRHPVSGDLAAEPAGDVELRRRDHRLEPHLRPHLLPPTLAQRQARYKRGTM